MVPVEITLKNSASIDGRGHFPRPDYIRIPSFSLNGTWMLSPDKKNKGRYLQWFNKTNVKKILHQQYYGEDFSAYPVEVPFPLEADINTPFHIHSGISPEQIVLHKRHWYFCSFSIANLKSGLLHFGASDYRTWVWLNGTLLGSHEGGYTPFSFHVSEFEEENYLAVLVEDSISPSQIRGKQSFLKKPFMVWYGNITGIWQDVWIEKIGGTYIRSVHCERQSQSVRFTVDVESKENVQSDVRVELQIFASQSHGKKGGLKTPIKVYRDIVMFNVFKKGEMVFDIPESIFDSWSISYPVVHPVQIILRKGTKEIDCIYSYFGRRNIEINNGTILLNKKKLYQRLLLNQGYYPEGLYRPVDSSLYKTDIENMKSMGFNGCRLHQKIEDPKFLYWADLLGFLVWSEMPSYYLPSRRNMKRLYAQLKEGMRRDCMHPSIITIVLYNESWGLYSMFISKSIRDDVIGIFKKIKAEYPGYLVIDNSGFHHVATDITDIHHYIKEFDDIEEFYRRLVSGIREAPLWANFFSMLMGKENVQTPYLQGYGNAEAPLVISEMGGFGFDMYESQAKTLEESFSKHCSLLAKFPQIQGFCYTQYTDTFQEKNGLFTFDRKPKARVLQIMQKAFSKHIFW